MPTAPSERPADLRFLLSPLAMMAFGIGMLRLSHCPAETINGG